ncbi:phosphate ABC transporter substrate-binding protein PstS [Candidatus Protofrankia datiscae]|uniref:phosphate ABC transporter substrate-binding protein PstS n=1 Tax=Candidatus Protofrankia datiscae TaxID=2716812 RepID=UPI0013EB435A|nr:phosphate ABC transporter substrate-binding protein PstS [Candidatus Protofrankia datiscae]
MFTTRCTRPRRVAHGRSSPGPRLTPGRLVPRVVAVRLLVTVFCLTLAACTAQRPDRAAGTSPDPQCAAGKLTGAGATFQQNLQARWISDFTIRCHDAHVTYESIGSGAGIQRFIDGSVDFAGSDAILTEQEQQAANKRCTPPVGAGSAPTGQALHIPAVGGALVFIYNLPGVYSLRLSPATAAGIFQGGITTWNDPRIAADNPGGALPALPVRPVHREDSSGSTDVFSRYLSAAAGASWRLGIGKELPWPGGSAAATGSAAVTASVIHNPGSITYVELSFAAEQGLPTAALRTTSGTYVTANGTSVAAALSSAGAAAGQSDRGDLRLPIDYTPDDPLAYPASAVTYTIVCARGNGNAELLRSYLAYTLAQGQLSTRTIGYAPLPDPTVSVARRLAASLG